MSNGVVASNVVHASVDLSHDGERPYGDRLRGGALTVSARRPGFDTVS